MIQSVAEEETCKLGLRSPRTYRKHYKRSLKAKSNLTIFRGYTVKWAKLAITRDKDLKKYFRTEHLKKKEKKRYR
jgi:hypothetical protein